MLVWIFCDIIRINKEKNYVTNDDRYCVGGIIMDNEKNKFDATKYKNDFQKEKYDRIIARV